MMNSILKMEGTVEYILSLLASGVNFAPLGEEPTMEEIPPFDWPGSMSAGGIFLIAN